jgi:hypothetical protein
MSVKPGRNDPCHCGSGKKYKHCHLALDEEARRAGAATNHRETRATQSAAESLDETVRTLQDLQVTGGAKKREEAERLLARATLLKSYLSRELEIQAAMQALEPYLEDFVNFSTNAAAFQEQVEAVFADDFFASSHFTVEDLQRAFDHLGSPLAVPKEKLKEHLQAAVLYLAHKDYRTVASINLLVALPGYVKSGRYRDGHLILNCAHMMSKDPSSTNPFLWQMFVHGYQAWTADKQSRLSE